MLLYFVQQQVADGWDKAREEDLIQKIWCGRRVLQVLGVSLHTALSELDASVTTLLGSLRGEVKAITAQPSRKGQTVSCHSRIAGDADDTLEQALLRLLKQASDSRSNHRRSSSATQRAGQAATGPFRAR